MSVEASDVTTGPVDLNAEFPRKRPRRWTLGSLTAVLVGVGAALASGQSTRPRTTPAQAPASQAAHTYKQAVVYYTRMAETLNEWEQLGWEPFQVVPIANANPGTGGAMQVALVFRKPTGAK